MRHFELANGKPVYVTFGEEERNTLTKEQNSTIFDDENMATKGHHFNYPKQIPSNQLRNEIEQLTGSTIVKEL